MRTLIKIQQTPKYNTFDPNIFSTTKRILKWKTYLWLINSQQEEVPLRFPETLKKFNIWWRNMKICLEDGFSKNEGFQKMPRVMPKSDEDGFRKMGIHRLLRTSINRSDADIRVSNELWKWKFFEIELEQNEMKWQREFPNFQMFLGLGVLWVSDLITSSFRFWCSLNCAPACWHGDRWLLTGKH